MFIKANKRRRMKKVRSKYIYPASGLQQDVNEFIAEFTEIGSFRFTEFAAVWRRRRFIEVIQGRHTQSALEDFYNCLFYHLVSLSQPLNPRLTQVCAVFMLYTFYFKQPIDNMIRIRLTASQWQSLVDLTNFLTCAGHLDGLMILSRLCDRGAFHRCATVQPYFPTVALVHCAASEMAGLLASSSSLSNQQEKVAPTAPHSTDQLAQVHRLYCEMKAKLMEDGHSHSLDILPKDSVELLKKILATSDVSGGRQPEPQPEGNAAAYEDTDNAAERRQKLKSAAFDRRAAMADTGPTKAIATRQPPIAMVTHSEAREVAVHQGHCQRSPPPIKGRDVKELESNTCVPTKRTKGAPRVPRKRRSDWHGSDSD